uniref:CSON008175 protein n=1 Tax=Culicoides sonorensis TaxID=179676 RepID=A0A336LEQ1_CULSO
MMQQKFSIVEYYGAGSGHRCGYCKSSSSSFSHGMWAHLLTAQDYQELINRGWRRSGKYCYKPNNKTTCCPLYTIKCDAMNFKLSKTHKKILKRMNRFLKDGKKGESSNDCPENEETASGDCHETFMTPSNDRAPAAICLVDEIVDMDCADGAVQSSKKVEKSKNDDVLKMKMTANEVEKHNSVNSGPDPSKPPCKKAKELRLERKIAKLAEKGLTLPSSNVKSNQEKTLEQFLSEQPDDGIHKLKLQLVPSSKGVTDQALKLYKKYQITVHNDPPSKLTEAGFRRFLSESPIKFTILGVKSAEFAKNVRTEYDLYKKYQTVIHDDPPSDFSEFEEFLVSSPLEVQHV